MARESWEGGIGSVPVTSWDSYSTEVKCCRWARVRKTCVYWGFEYCLSSISFRASESQAVNAEVFLLLAKLHWNENHIGNWPRNYSSPPADQLTVGLKPASKWIKSSWEQTPGLGRSLLVQWSKTRGNRAKPTEKCCSIKQREDHVEDLKEEQVSDDDSLLKNTWP